MKKLFTYQLAVLIAIFALAGTAAAYAGVLYPLCHFQIKGNTLFVCVTVNNIEYNKMEISVSESQITVIREQENTFDVTVHRQGAVWPDDGMTLYRVSADNLSKIAESIPIVGLNENLRKTSNK